MAENIQENLEEYYTVSTNDNKKFIVPKKVLVQCKVFQTLFESKMKESLTKPLLAPNFEKQKIQSNIENSSNMPEIAPEANDLPISNLIEKQKEILNLENMQDLEENNDTNNNFN